MIVCGGGVRYTRVRWMCPQVRNLDADTAVSRCARARAWLRGALRVDGAHVRRGSWEAALRAAGAVLDAVDAVVSGAGRRGWWYGGGGGNGGDGRACVPAVWGVFVRPGCARNAFCAVRPPGHHAGPQVMHARSLYWLTNHAVDQGVVTSEHDRDGSHGFCLLNNVAIGAAYARAKV